MSATGRSDYQVEGRVRFSNLVAIRNAGEAAIAGAGPGVVIDLSGLEHSNSAAVALLMAWYRAAANDDKTIRFVGAPTDLENIIELSGLSDVLAVETSEGNGTSGAFPAQADA